MCIFGVIEVLCTIARRHAANNVNPASTDNVLKAVRQDFAGFLRIDLEDAVISVAESSRNAPVRRLHPPGARPCTCCDSLGATVVLIASDAELLAAASAEGFPTLDPVLDPPLPAP